MPTDQEALTPHQKWEKEIDYAERELKKFHKRAQSTTKRFLDERDTANGDAKWFNIFYANTQILESALYSQLPKPAVTRRFKDYDDDVARVAATILQRSITQDLDDPRDTFDYTMRQAVQDRLVPGLAQAWLRLETTTEDIPAEEGGEDLSTGPIAGAETEEPPAPMKRITDQRICVDYVFWKDFLWSPCRVWDERRWVGRKVYMDRDKLVERFGEDKGKLVPLDNISNKTLSAEEGQGSTPLNDAIQKAVIYEIWDRTTRKVLWFSRGVDFLLDEEDDPLGLVGFEPCPRPMLANVSTSNAAPRPDYYMIQDQYQELDTVNNRISKLVQACKVVGVYDQAAKGVARMLQEGFDNQLIPVDNWAMFAEKGGIKGQVNWLPLDVVVAALVQLNLAREAIKAQIYEITGIADIVRGASKASETLGAQEIKAKFASVRIQKLQDEVARFASEIMRIKAEMQIKHFEPQIMLAKSNIASIQTDAPFVDQAIALLKSEEGFEWRVQVTADSIAQADYSSDKQDRIDFLTAVSSYLEKAGGMFQIVPGSASLLIGMLKWAVAGFRNSSEIEGLIDKELDAITKNPPQDKPDPEAEKLKAEQQMAQQQFQLETQKAQQQMQMEQQKAQMELQKMRQEMELQREKMQMELEFMREKMDMELQKARTQLSIQAQKGAQDLEVNAAKGQQALAQGELQTQAAKEQHQMQMEFSEQDHKQSLKQGEKKE